MANDNKPTTEGTPNPNGGNNEMGQKFTGLPMRELIASPLVAVCEAQTMLASSSFDFMNKIGFADNKTRLLEFELERPVKNIDGSMGRNTITVKAPLLGLVPTPNLLIEDVHIDFQMEVTMAETTTEKKVEEANVKASYKGWFGVSAEVQGKVSSSRETTRSTNQTAKYQVSVNARQQRPSEGMSKLMDLFASCVEPIEVKNNSGTGSGTKTSTDAEKPNS